MKNLHKLKVIFLIFTIIFTTQATAADQILPIPKPTPDEETKVKITQKKHIYPEKKPTLKKEKIEVTESEEIAEISDEVIKEVIIYPEKKPLIFEKKIDKAITKSTILSRKDFNIAKAAFEAIDKKKMANCCKAFKKS